MGSAFEDHLQEFQHSHCLSAAGAHHSNCVAERGNGTIMLVAQAMLHHSDLHWPDVADIELWLLAVLHAVHLLNRIPRTDTGQSSLELFSRKTFPYLQLQDFHIWGCPVYALDSTLADQKKVPAWRGTGASRRRGLGLSIMSATACNTEPQFPSR